MKFWILSIIGSMTLCSAQSINVTTAGVGIGTTAPTSALDVNGIVTIQQKNFGGPAGFLIRGFSPSNNWPAMGFSLQNTNNQDFTSGLITGQIINNNSGAEAMDLYISTANAGALVERLRITRNGNVGIGTNTPSSLLDVNGVIFVEQKNFGGPAGLLVRGLNPSSNWPAMGFTLQNSNNQDFISGLITGQIINSASGAEAMDLYFSTASAGSTIERLRITNGGNVGIGTNAPTQKLEVAGNVKATSFITPARSYADYVFAPDYSLPTLQEVEAHIKEHRHLPGVASEKEVTEKGINLGDMQVQLLAQTEQLMLHVIALNKQVQAQAALIEQQAQQIQVQAEEVKGIKVSAPRPAL